MLTKKENQIIYMKISHNEIHFCKIKSGKFHTFFFLVETFLFISLFREERLRVLYDRIECGLTLLGATAVEDKLQEGVRIKIFTEAPALNSTF